MSLKKGDKVLVITGKDKGVKSVIETVLPKKNQVLVENVNIKTCFLKNMSQQTKEMVKKSFPIDISNVKKIS